MQADKNSGNSNRKRSAKDALDLTVTNGQSQRKLPKNPDAGRAQSPESRGRSCSIISDISNVVTISPATASDEQISPELRGRSCSIISDISNVVTINLFPNSPERASPLSKSRTHSVGSDLSSLKGPGSDFSVAIAGGGAGGVGAALELANAGYHVNLYEKKEQLLFATSNKTPGRAGLGYHYVHKKTAELYLKATIEVAKRYPESLLGFGDNPENNFLRHGLYCIMKQKEDIAGDDKSSASIYTKQQILETYDTIKECYRTLVDEDLSNKIFGEPDNFHKVLTAEEMQQYSETINLDIVDVIVDTREQLLNWPKLRKTLIEEVSKHPKITVHLNATIDSPAQKDDDIGFTFTVNGEPQEANVFINATWEGIEALNQKLGIIMEPDSRTNRLKIIVTMLLPPEQKNHPSVFCAMGPHTMVSNMGNGRIMCTYSPATNVSSSTGLEIPNDFRRFLEGDVMIEEEMEKAIEIRKGASKYLPFVRDAKIVITGYGIIKTRGSVDLFDPNSAVNKREEIGVEEHLLGWIDNACMKLLHFVMNGREVLALVKKTERAQENMRQWPGEIVRQCYSKKGDLFIKQVLLECLLRKVLSVVYTKAPDFEPKEEFSIKRGFFCTVEAKIKLMAAVQGANGKPNARVILAKT